MKIRRITVIALIVLSLLMFIDIRYNVFSRLNRVRRTPVQYQIGAGGREPTFTATQEFRLPQGNLTGISVENHFGMMEVRRTDQPEIVVIATVKAFDPSVEEAEKRIEGWEAQEKISGSQVSYSWFIPTSQRENVQTDFIVEVPEGMTVRLEQGFGTVEVFDLSGQLGIEANFSTVLVQDFSGAVTIDSSYSTVNLRNILGPLKVSDSFSTLVASLVKNDEGYNIDVDLSFGTLRGNVPYTMQEKEMNELRAKGSYGRGVYPVVISSSFGTVDLSLID